MNYPVKLTAEEFKKGILRKLTNTLATLPDEASDEQFYKACALFIRDILEEKRKTFLAECNSKGEKQVYYLSMEFLMGKSLKNSIYNLGIQDVVVEALGMLDIKIEHLYRCEPDPGLGNGGLGRLAACFLDGLATDNFLATGHSILYEYGIFKQRISDGWQSELPDYWLPGGDVWLQAVPEHTIEVRFGGNVEEHWDVDHHMIQHVNYTTVLAVPYNMYVTGYDSKSVSILRLWKAKAPGIDMDLFNSGDYLGAFGKNSYAEVISKVLYPNDNHAEGKLLRLRQQYFLACSSVADIFRRHMSVYGTVENFAEKNAIHINDTHPTLAIPELMRLLLDECGYSWEMCWGIVKDTFAYTNHTVMVEALEQWDIDQMQTLLPRIYQIICEINRRFCEELHKVHHLSDEEINRMSIVGNGKVRMANLCVVGSHSVNGVSTLHSQIIRDDLFNDFHKIYDGKFKNVTNGIASRRWLMQSNPRLNDFIIEHIGDEFLHNFSRLTDLEKLLDNKEALEELAQIKYRNKLDFACYLHDERGITVNPHSMFDVQVKRLHEYKRQQLNALHIVLEYLRIKENPSGDHQAKTYFFGAKAAPGYYLAKQIIKFICDLGNLIDNDPDVNTKLKVVFLEEYNVTMSERLMPACEISQQISLAGTEASGTGNMKLMLNGALTLGTLDGANVEISEVVGKDNIMIFGMTTPEVENMKCCGYHPYEFIQRSKDLQKVLNFIQSRGDIASFAEVYRYITTVDAYMAAADFDSYAKAQAKLSEIYSKDNVTWQKMSLKNIAQSGIFCADRSIHDYARTIWKLK